MEAGHSRDSTPSREHPPQCPSTLPCSTKQEVSTVRPGSVVQEFQRATAPSLKLRRELVAEAELFSVSWNEGDESHPTYAAGFFGAAGGDAASLWSGGESLRGSGW